MKSKRLIIALFVITVLAQLYVPAQMILSREDVLKTGKEFKFVTRPVDPNDPFRGKYISLDIVNDEFLLDSGEYWQYPEQYYVIVRTADDGFAEIVDVTIEEPSDSEDYLMANSSRSSNINHRATVFIDYPFNKFYMEESKAQEAEDIYRESLSDSTKIAYALVAIKGGQSVLKDVLINDVPIREVVLEGRSDK